MDRLRPLVVVPLALGAVAALIAFSAHTIVDDRGEVSAFFDNRVYYAILFASVALCALRAIAGPDHRPAWGLIAAGVAVWTAGDIYWLLQLGDIEDPPFPSLSDAGYLAYFPLVYAGLLVLLRKRLRASRAVWLDGLTAALATGSVVAAVLLRAALDSTGGSVAAVGTNVAYPAGDLILLGLLVGAVAIGRGSIGRAPLLLAAGLVIGAVADGIYLFQAAEGSYVEGTFLDALWPASMLCIALAAWSDEVRVPSPALPARPLLLVPLVCGGVAVAIVVVGTRWELGTIAVVLAAATMVAVLIRLFETLRENRTLLQLTQTEAVTDPLTGLANRRKLLLDLEHACASLADGRTWLLALFDLDGFKQYNDSFGHPAGDALLVRLGAKLEQAAGPGARAYRHGGDEFCLLIPGSIEQAAAGLDAAAAALVERGEAFTISSSFGAVFLPEDARDPSEALRLADVRLYAQKRARQARRDRPHDALVQALHEREPSLAEHARAVVELSVAVGRRLGLADDELDVVERVAQLHDVGKLAVPDDILKKPGRLTPDEELFIRQHTVIGERILSAAPALQQVAALVRSTHEHWDGAGYPDGLAGAAIPLSSRIVAASDAYVAMRESRAYRAATPEAVALLELRRCAGQQFDPQVVQALLAVVSERRAAVA